MSRPRRSPVAAVCAMAIMACAVMAACSGKTTQAGGLEVVLRTDMPVPAAFDSLHVEISQQIAGGKWNLLLKNDLPVQDDASLPTTISITAGSSGDQEALVEVTATKDGAPVVLREIQVQVPTSRVALLDVLISSACAGKLQVVGGVATTSCADPTQSCQPDTGACGATNDTKALPPYVPGNLPKDEIADATVEAAPPAGPEGGEAGSAGDDGAAPDASTGCTPATTSSCAEDTTGQPVPGLTATLNGVGPCHLGTKTCTGAGAWGPCMGAVGPQNRDCESAQDLNCDGVPDNTIDAVCQCNAAHPTVACTGSNNCPGTRSCDANHQLQACSAPAACQCTDGATETCSGGANNCPGGTQTCASGTWGPCTGAPMYCDCTAGQTRACSAINGAWPCGTATCSSGQWNTAPCTPAVSWCQDSDGDGYCSTTCVTACTGPQGTKANCPSTPAQTDCNDANPNVNPATPLDCTAATSCVKQSMIFSSSSSSCQCTSTATAANNGAACANYSTCSGGTCTCNSGAKCSLNCMDGTVSCILGPSCQTSTSSAAGTPCGSASYCNGSGACWTNCTLGAPKCAVGSCIAGSTNITCSQGSFCDINYTAAGNACVGPPGTCDGKGNCN